MPVLSAALSACLLIGPGPVGDTLSSAYAVSERVGALPGGRVSGTALSASPSAAEAVREFTGLQIKDYGGVGGLKTVNVRSLGSKHVGVYLDGIAIEEAQNMQVDLGRISLWGMDEVSLYSGQKDNALQTAKEYGTAAALHFSSARPGNLLRARVTAGSFGSFSPALLLERRLGSSLAIRTQAEYTRSDGDFRYHLNGYRKDGEGEWRRFDTTLVRENGDLESFRAEAGLYGRLWHVGARYYGSERGFPGPVVRRASEFPLSADRQRDRDWSVQGQWSGSVSRYRWALKGKYADSYTHYATHPERNPMAMSYDNYYRQRSAYLSLAQSVDVAKVCISLASDVQYNTLSSDVGQFVRPSRLSAFTALAARWAIRSFRASASLLHTFASDRYDREAGGFTRKNASRSVFSPFFSIDKDLGRRFHASLFAKRSYRMPSFNDLYYTLIGNASLSPEDARQLDAALRYSWKDYREIWAVNARAEAYRNRVLDKIVAIPTASQFRWTMLNLGKVDITGAELEAGVRKSGRIFAGTTLRYTFQRAVDHTEPGSATYGNQIPYIPLHSGSVAFDAGWNGWRLDWTTVYSGLRYSRTSNIPDYEVDAFSTTDLRLSRTLSLPSFSRSADTRSELTLRLSVNNLFGERYSVVQGYPMPGTYALFGVEWSL